MIKSRAAGALSASLMAALAALLPALAYSATAPRVLDVTGDRVNLRAAPNSEAEVLGQVSRGDTLVLQGEMSDAWVKVEPPASVNLWVFASLVKDGKVVVSSAQVRSGAGLNYHVVGRLQRGDAVNVRGQVGDWLKIAPFPEASAWVTNSFVSLSPQKAAPQVRAPAQTAVPVQQPPAQAAAPAPPVQPPAQTGAQASSAPPAPSPPPPRPTQTAAPTPAPKPAAGTSAPPAAKPAAANPAPSPQPRRTLLGNRNETVGPALVPASNLRGDLKQAERGSFDGVLALSPAGPSPSRYRLVAFEGSSPRTICYVLGNNRQLESLRGGKFTIEGVVYWYRGESLPTIFAQDILRHKK